MDPITPAALFVALRDQGKAILLVSVELEEILALSDRIVVMFDGRIMGERAAAATDERELGLLMAGMESAPADKPAWQAAEEHLDKNGGSA